APVPSACRLTDRHGPAPSGSATATCYPGVADGHLCPLGSARSRSAAKGSDMLMMLRRCRVALLSVSALLAAAATPTAHAADVGGQTLAGVAGTGIHNTYDDKSTYTYLADALDTGTSL